MRPVLQIKRTGFSLLEIILAIAIFSGASISVGYLIIDAGQATDVSSKKIGTTFLAREGLEVVRSIRDRGGFSYVTNSSGTGLSFDSGADEWDFSGSSEDVSDDGVYTRTIVISNGPDSYIKEITSTVTAESGGRTISTSLTTYLTDWQ